MDFRPGKAFWLILLSLVTATEGSSLLDDGKSAVNVKSENTAELFPLPPGYNKLVIPAFDGSLLFVSMHFFIFRINSIEPENGILELEAELGLTWQDWHIWKYLLENQEVQTRLAAESGGYYYIDSQFLHSVWRPDVSSQQLASVDTTYLLSKQFSLYVGVGPDPQEFGTIQINSKVTLRFRCQMDFKYYPADTQKCGISFLSYTYPDDEFLLAWDKDHSVYLDETSDSNYDFQVSDVEPGGKYYNRYTTYQQPLPSTSTPLNMSTISFTIQVRRNLVYHVVQTFLPSVLLILITWLCFLLPADMIEARIGISMTTLLTMIALFGAVRSQAPRVSYAMAIDFWMLFCIQMIFLVLVLFTVMYWMRSNLGKKVGPDPESGDSGAKSNPQHAWNEKLDGNVAAVAAVKYNPFIKYTTRYAFLFFAAVFIVFVVLFAVWILTASEYFNWTPPPTYNALNVDVDGAGNEKGAHHIFSMKGTPYSTNSKDTDQKQRPRPGSGQPRDEFDSLVRSTLCSRIKAHRPNYTCVDHKRIGF